MPNIDPEKYKYYLELSNRELNKQLEEAIKNDNYDKIRSVISDAELQSIDDKVYGLLFLNQYPMHPHFSTMLKNSDLSDIVNFFIQRIPNKFLSGENRRSSFNNIPYIQFIFSYGQDSIPYLLKALLESNRDDITVFSKFLVSMLKERIEIYNKTGSPYFDNESFAAYSCSDKLNDYHNAMDAIKTYCTKTDNGDYEVIPNYLFAIKTQSQELKQLFKDTVAVIKCGSLDKVQSALKAIEANVSNADLVVIDEVKKALGFLEKQAKQNVDIIRAISHSQLSLAQKHH